MSGGGRECDRERRGGCVSERECVCERKTERTRLRERGRGKEEESTKIAAFTFSSTHKASSIISLIHSGAALSLSVDGRMSGTVNSSWNTVFSLP